MTTFPDPAARTPDEAALLAAVLADLPNDLPKLVYADWLDDRGDDRGDFLRRLLHAARTGGELPASPAGTAAGWLALTGYELLAGLRENDLTHLTDVLLRLAQPAVEITAERLDGRSAPVGASRFGGDPGLPSDVAWPTDRTGPLPFVAQINLAEIAGSAAARELPAAGLLSVFYDGQVWGEDDQGWRLVHTLLDTPPSPPVIAQRLRPGVCAGDGTVPVSLSGAADHPGVGFAVDGRDRLAGGRLRAALGRLPRPARPTARAPAAGPPLPGAKRPGRRQGPSPSAEPVLGRGARLVLGRCWHLVFQRAGGFSCRRHANRRSAVRDAV